MLKNILNLGLVYLISLNSLIGYGAIPEQFTVTEKLFSWTTAFEIEANGYPLGRVERRILGQAPLQYDFYDINNYLMAQGTMRWFTFGAVFDVTDWNRNLIGTVEEEVFTFLPSFELFSPYREKLAHAKMNFWGTKYTVTDPVTDIEIATLTRPFFSFNSQWTVTITNPEVFASKNISPSLFIIVAAFQTDLEYWEHYEIAAYCASTSPSPKANEGRALRQQLKTYGQEIKDVVPSEQDFARVEVLVESVLKDRRCRFKSEKERLQAGIKELLPLFESEELTPEEKAALSQMIDQVY